MKHKTKLIKFTASKSSGEVSGIIYQPEKQKAFYVFAHGAGAGMNHSFMEKVAGYFADEGVGTMRFNFPYKEKGKKGPDPAPILMETIRSAVKTALKYSGDDPLFAGGKSMGGRMTSMAASDSEKEGMEKVKGIIFFGFPLHAPGKPSNDRAEHLYKIKIPMLFLQGTNDKLANLELLKPVIKTIGRKAELHIIEDGDHSFHVPKSSGKNDEVILKELVTTAAGWINKF
jgi:predicted alpha/beta-hydrolase family hydrolase